MVATRPVDFRCGHQALALIVQNELKLDPHSGVTVIFRSKRGDRLKILVWDGSGLVLIYKRLEQGNFAWPRIQDGVNGDDGPTSRFMLLSVVGAPPQDADYGGRDAPRVRTRSRFIART
ncbi:IS66 family insertion sequence element accessory protein TnpB [Cereibacter azotoformans]|uniref:IS66 Orf2 family protein n=1 Tax=Cereibacter sphaeroides (strain ATCC 17025 / ATH 2.4.3) TaxID=349102 RepID=A4WR24_CERS5|nr:IS66 family insertion sequence element accessory protein TnpB [Cereibacter azotoformans]ULB09190.1 IS66 family insertion sequence element accessory protein TnpB [Cereibacter azotoformans]